ncbi:hypothetical protein ACFPM7_28790 [Actinokineospora guangxiensis]|uniref:Uncharacterized protein n=1 Tax=Actinokineospora guangxiensis TaxID=1490288 RepID=A0ABW0EYR2_9PSEU
MACAGTVEGNRIVTADQWWRTAVIYQVYWDWHTHTAAVWLYAERAPITAPVVLRELDIEDSNYHGLLFSWQKAISPVTVDSVRVAGTGGATETFDDGAGQVTNANSHGLHFDGVTGTGRFDRVAVSGLKGAGSQGSVNTGGHTIQRGTGNTGW